jgi:hypothetical protein
MIFAWKAVISPSFVAAIRTWSTWPRPWWLVAMFSERVSIHFTGWPSCLEAHAHSVSSAHTCSLLPKPPPTSGAMTRT